MTATISNSDAAGDGPIPYLERTRTYYSALGHSPYVWAHFEDVPFTILAKPLTDCVVSIVTTAAPYQDGKGDQGPGAPYNAAAKFYSVYSGDVDEDHDLRISHIAIDRVHTTAKDQRSYFPLEALRVAAARGRLRLGRKFYGLPTNRSQRITLDVDCKALLAQCKSDGVDAILFAANCPICHQSVSLAARVLEEQGIATVVMGCAKDIVEYVGVPRFLFSDFPLGNAAGKPDDPASQTLTLDLAIGLLEHARSPRTTLQSPLRWSDDPSWKLDYSNIDRLSPEEIKKRCANFEADREAARQIRNSTTA